MSGAILDAGTSFYSHKGGQLVSAAILGTPVDLSNSEIEYSLDATISGLTASGAASFKLETDSPGGFHTFTTGSASIVGMLPAEQFPLGCTLGVDCTSAIPGAFLGAADIKIVTCHGDMEDGQCGTAQEFVSPMTFESAFLNPFGGPIFMATDGGEVFIVADYTAARVTWTGIQLGGTVSGSLAGSPVSGLFAMNVAAVEDLKGGSEVDSGSIMFVGMSDPTLNAAGQFTGLSIIPAGTPCPASIPFPPGTCQLTGFTSSGDFSQTTALGHAIAGHYNTVWIVPAVAFSSTISATLT
jgi:hypothetical protein